MLGWLNGNVGYSSYTRSDHLVTSAPGRVSRPGFLRSILKTGASSLHLENELGGSGGTAAR